MTVIKFKILAVSATINVSYAPLSADKLMQCKLPLDSCIAMIAQADRLRRAEG